MLVICCKTININVDTRTSNSQNFDNITNNPDVRSFKVNKKDTAQEVIIIAFYEAIISYIHADMNIVIISPKIIFSPGYKIDLSNISVPTPRSPNLVEGMRGLRGLPGLSGYNMSLLCKEVTCNDNFSCFISTGGRGGRGQEGSPGGKGGYGGKGGILVINETIVRTGEQGQEGEGLGESTIGNINPKENKVGIGESIGDFIQYIYQSMSDLKLIRSDPCFDFFGIKS